MDDAVRAWVETTVGGTVVNEERPSVGGSRDVALIDLERDDGVVVPLVVRSEGSGCFSGTEISLTREAVVYEALTRRRGSRRDLRRRDRRCRDLGARGAGGTRR